MKMLEKVLHGAAAIILFLMFVLCVMQVVFRFILKVSAPWTEEFARMGYIWLVYLMLPVLEFNDDQLKVTYFLDRFPYRLRVVVYWLLTLLSVIFLAFLTIGSFKFASNRTIVSFASTSWLTVNIQYIPIVIGAALGILFVIRRAIRMKETLRKAEEEYEV